MIKYNNKTINGMNYESSNVKKVIHNSSVVYATFTSGGTPPTPPTPTLQWVTFNNGDTIPSDLDIYGISGTAQNLLYTFGCDIDASICFNIAPRNKIEYSIFDSNGFVCTSDNTSTTDIVSIVFSDYGCVDYLNKAGTISGTIQLYIYA